MKWLIASLLFPALAGMAHVVGSCSTAQLREAGDTHPSQASVSDGGRAARADTAGRDGVMETDCLRESAGKLSACPS